MNKHTANDFAAPKVEGWDANGKVLRLPSNPYLEEFNGLSLEASSDSFSKRMKLCTTYSYAIPNEKALKEIAKLSPLVEMGAGTGYWAWLLRQRGVDIWAYNHPNWKTYNPSETWTGVIEAPSCLMKFSPSRNLLLCWPPYKETFAYECLKNFRGEYVIYIGEWRECCAESYFFDLLEYAFEKKRQITIPQWEGISDAVWVYQRKAR